MLRMIILDLMLFLLPFPIAYVTVPRALTASGLLISAEVHASFRNAFWLYAALIFASGIGGSADLTMLSSPFALLVIVLTGWEVFSRHRHHSMSWLLIAGHVVLLVGMSWLPGLISKSVASILAVWLLAGCATLVLAVAWLTMSPLSDLNKGRILATAIYTLCLALIGSIFLFL